MYKNIRETVKLKRGGLIPKFQTPFAPISPEGTLAYKIQTGTATQAEIDMYKRQIEEESDEAEAQYNSDLDEFSGELAALNKVDITDDTFINNVIDNTNSFKAMMKEKQKSSNNGLKTFKTLGKKAVTDTLGSGGWQGAAVAAMNVADNALMGDKNFGTQSKAIDSAVHGASGMLMRSGNPYAMLAGVALEGANFLTKAGGETVQGFDVNVNSSGYGNIGHMEPSSSRDFGTFLGLGGLNRKTMQSKLARRNEQARMALEASDVADEQRYEEEARMNSIDNTIINNQIALAGGLQTNLLGS